jgi:hypothetical protein
MAITREQIKTANKRGSAAIARGRAARYDARRALIVISLEGGCEFSFPTALAAARCRPLRSSAHRRRFRFTLMDATYR